MRWDIPFGENMKSRAHRRKLRELPHQKPAPPAKPKPKDPPPAKP